MKLENLESICLLALAATANAVWAQVQAAPPLSGVIGAVQSFTGSSLDVVTKSGVVHVSVSQPLTTYKQMPSDLSHVTSTSYAGVGSVEQADGTERATQILVFPEELRGAAEGSVITDATPGTTTHSRMTNGSISRPAVSHSRMTNGTVQKGSGTTLVVRYQDGAQTILVPPNVPVTEADIFISGNGGAANDVCSLVSFPCSNYGGHTPLVIPVNDRNYVFDVYPPGTDLLGFGRPKVNGTFAVARPVLDASLQWRMVDHSSELPAHACGDFRAHGCLTVEPIICLLDSSTPPPDQTETSCPAVPPNPTRLRVILPFAGSQANFFARSILLGWDDVPTPVHNTPPVRTRINSASPLE